MIDILCRNSGSDISVTPEERLCVEIAGLCHDLGHGPLSHSWERYLKASGIDWKVKYLTIYINYYLYHKFIICNI